MREPKLNTEDIIQEKWCCHFFCVSVTFALGLRESQPVIIIWSFPPLQTDISHFCKMKYLHKKETHNKNEDNTLKERNKIFLTVYGLPK